MPMTASLYFTVTYPSDVHVHAKPYQNRGTRALMEPFLRGFDMLQYLKTILPLVGTL